MKRLFRTLLFTRIVACNSNVIDPDALPSVEVLLVPPKVPFPQVHEELMLLREKREAKNKKFESRIQISYQKEKALLIKAISDEVSQAMSGITGKVRRSPTSSLIEATDNDRNVENVVVQVMPTAEVPIQIKESIIDIDSKLQLEESKQIQQGIKEFGEISKIIKETVKKGIAALFKSNGSGMRQPKPSFTQLSDGSNSHGIKDVLNLRFGSSTIGDGLSDGASYPSIPGMIRDEHMDRASAESALLNEILFFSRQLGLDVVAFLQGTLFPPSGSAASSFIDPSSYTTKLVRQAMQYLPPGLARVWRKRAMEHSTIEVDLYPPGSDWKTDKEMLNASLKSYEVLRRARLKAYVAAKERVTREIVRIIEKTIKSAAEKWGLITTPDNLPTFSLQQLVHGKRNS